MTKTITNRLIAGAAVAALFAPVLALAATTASLSPASANVVAGQKFNVTISINPQGTANYAEKLEVDYPADILEISSFTLGGSWLAMTASGYDSIDNTNGVLIKTAGYPGGFSSATAFGTISFSAKKAGSGTIEIGNTSLAFQSSAQSAITGTGTTFAVTAPVVAPAPTPTPTPTPEVKTPASKPTLKAIPAPSVTKPATTTESTSTQSVNNASLESQTASAGAPAGSGNSWIWVLVAVVLLVVLIGGAYLMSNKKS